MLNDHELQITECIRFWICQALGRSNVLDLRFLGFIRSSMPSQLVLLHTAGLVDYPTPWHVALAKGPVEKL